MRIIAPEPPPPAPVPAPPPVAPPAVHAVKPDPAPAPSTVAGGATAAPAALKPCERPVTKPTLRFSDPAGFDQLLRGKLRRARPVVVDMDTPYPVGNEAPAPLGAWLNEVAQSGGTVSVDAYCQKGRSLGSFFARLFGGGPAEPYKAARKYDAVLHVDSLDQVVTQVEFTPRKGRK